MDSSTNVVLALTNWIVSDDTRNYPHENNKDSDVFSHLENHGYVYAYTYAGGFKISGVFAIQEDGSLGFELENMAVDIDGAYHNESLSHAEFKTVVDVTRAIVQNVSEDESFPSVNGSDYTDKDSLPDTSFNEEVDNEYPDYLRAMGVVYNDGATDSRKPQYVQEPADMSDHVCYCGNTQGEEEPTRITPDTPTPVQEFDIDGVHVVVYPLF